MRKRHTIRDKLGLSLSAICTYLGVSRSVYLQYQRGERNFNSQALQKAGLLEAAFTQWMTGDYDLQSTPPDPGAANILDTPEHRKQECTKRLTAVNEKLLAMKKTYSLLQFQWDYFHQQLSVETGRRRIVELEILLEEVSEALKGCNTSDQLLLQQKADMLLAEIHLLDGKAHP